jgi:anti-sigma B factor antagonist
VAVAIGQIGVTPEGESLVLTLTGEHDLSTAPDVRAALEEAVAAGGNLIVDMAQTAFIDSSILGVLVEAYRRVTADPSADRSFAIVATPGGPVTRLLDLVAVSDLLQVYATRTEAIAAVNGAGS